MQIRQRKKPCEFRKDKMAKWRFYYKVKAGRHCDFKNAALLEKFYPDFSVRLENEELRVEFLKDCSVDDARSIIQPFIDAWEISAGVSEEYGPGEFSLAFWRAELPPRRPGNDADIGVSGTTLTALVGDVAVHTSRGRFPSPPAFSAFKITDDVKTMFHQVRLYHEGKIPVVHMAYFCLSILEKSAGGRREAANKYSIGERTLDKIGNLTANKGGKEARKADGLRSELSAEERQWLLHISKKLIARVAELEANPAAKFDRISSLPPTEVTES
jgi:hypothetical protein